VAKLVSPKVVKYRGMSDNRVMRARDWAGQGSSLTKDTVWNASNNWAIPIDQFDDEALRYLTEVDNEFVIQDVVVDK
jgi:hypothetical protein